MAAAAALPRSELLSVPGAALHRVINNEQALVEAPAEFSVALLGEPPSMVQAAVGAQAWPLGKHLPALKAAPGIYSFALEHTRAEYLILVLPQDTPPDVLAAVDDVLHEVCAYTTVKQVDAAAEEADKLAGSKQAAEAAELAQAAEPAAPAAAGGAAPAAAGAGAAPRPGIQAGKYQLPSSGNSTADRVAQILLWGGSMLATGIASAAGATAGAIASYSAKQQAKGATSTASHAKVSPGFKKGLAVAGVVASSAAYVTGKLAELVGQASMATALAIAKSLPGHKAKAPGELVSSEERGALHTVGAAGLVAFVDVYDSLEAAAKCVFAQSAESTASYITYKYGAEAGAAAQASVPVAKDMLTATCNFSRLGARAFISKTAKQSAKVYLKSTMAGVHPDDQAAGKRMPKFGAPAAAAAPPAADGAQRHASSSHVAQPYPPGPAAAAAAGGAPR